MVKRFSYFKEREKITLIFVGTLVNLRGMPFYLLPPNGGTASIFGYQINITESTLKWSRKQKGPLYFDQRWRQIKSSITNPLLKTWFLVKNSHFLLIQRVIIS